MGDKSLMLAYQVKRLTKVYGAQGPVANDNIDLEIPQGELFGIFGPNGAGKTTLVRQMAGLLKPTSGQIYLFGYDVIANPSVVPHYVGYYGQKVLALEAHKFWEVLYITGLLRGQSRADAQRQTHSLIERFRGREVSESAYESTQRRRATVGSPYGNIYGLSPDTHSRRTY